MITSNPVHTGRVKKGKFISDNRDYFKHDLESFEGKQIEIVIKESKRGDDFNRYYHAGVVKVFMDFFNQEKTFGRSVDKEFVHELLAGKFLGFSQQVIPGGEIVMMRNKSSKLTTREFWDYVTYCKSWGEEFFNLNFPESPKKIVTKVQSTN